MDGEHYPPVVKDALESLERDYGYEVVAAVFVGGSEKIIDRGSIDLGLPLYHEEGPAAAMAAAIRELGPDTVIDLSDEPVLDYVKRMKLASLALALGVAYVGADFRFDPPYLEDVLTKPSLGIIGTGKRVGKTAVSGFACRTLQASGFAPVAIAMGRGGPPEPEVLRGGEIDLSSSMLLGFADEGKHAASDYFEDALTSRITTIGCRRCGGGLAGAPFVSNVAEGARTANVLEERFVVAEGSGATLPPIRVDGYILTVGAGQPLDYISGYFGTYRALISDLVVVTMCEEPFADPKKVDRIYSAVKAIKPEIRVINTVFEPKPLGPIRGRRLFVASTASPAIESKLRLQLEEAGAEVVGMSFSLSNRAKLREELAAAERADTVLTELKAAAVDVVTREAAARGLDVVYLDNEPVAVGGDGELAGAVVALADLAVERFSTR
ncbi:MAG: 2,3-diphosphoglycerate synthetase [Candidatus Aquicultorales bacterium]